MHKTAVVAAAALFLIVIPGVVSGAGPFQGGLNFVVAVPQDEFDEELENNGYGLSGHLAYRIPGGFISFGGSLGYIIYGSETRKEPFSTTIPDVTVDVKTTNSLVAGHLILRAQPPSGVFRPYLEGLVGFHHLRTDTEIRGEDYEEITSSNNFSDTALSYGAGGGLMLGIYKSPPGKRPVEVFLDTGARYLKGGEAEYLEKGSIERSGGKISFDISQSNTDVVLFHFGVSANF